MIRSNLILFSLVLSTMLSCSKDNQTYSIVGDIDDPKNEITISIANLVNRELDDSLAVKLSKGSLSNLDSIEQGVYDFMVVDNFADYREDISAIVPLFPQILHILYRRKDDASSFNTLLTGKKIYAGIEGTSTRLFVNNLLNDFQVEKDSVEFVGVLDLFNADVIFSFTDLISITELIDIQDYKLYSFDDPKHIGTGTIAEGICLRYPQFQTFIIPRLTYGDYTPEAVLTVSNDAILVCRKDLDTDLIYNVAKVIHENKQEFSKISPLLFHGISENYEVQNLSFTLHPGARRYLERYAPTIFEKYAEVFGVIFSIVFAVVTGGFTYYNYRKSQKKNKIDVYYVILTKLRDRVPHLTKPIEFDMLQEEIKKMQKETIDLVVREKLNADASFQIFMQLCQLVSDEAFEARHNLIKKGV